MQCPNWTSLSRYSRANRSIAIGIKHGKPKKMPSDHVSCNPVRDWRSTAVNCPLSGRVIQSSSKTRTPAQWSWINGIDKGQSLPKTTINTWVELMVADGWPYETAGSWKRLWCLLYSIQEAENPLGVAPPYLPLNRIRVKYCSHHLPSVLTQKPGHLLPLSQCLSSNSKYPPHLDPRTLLVNIAQTNLLIQGWPRGDSNTMWNRISLWILFVSHCQPPRLLQPHCHLYVISNLPCPCYRRSPFVDHAGTVSSSNSMMCLLAIRSDLVQLQTIYECINSLVHKPSRVGRGCRISSFELNLRAIYLIYVFCYLCIICTLFLI